MATFYFNAAVNNDWATLGNWWMNSSYTIAATALPTASDDAIIDGYVAQNTGSDITLSNLTVNSAGFVFFSSLSGALTVTGVATFNDGAYTYEGTINGNCIFNNNSYTNAIINGNCIFNDSFVSINGTITGDCTFNGDSFSSGIVIGDCIFNGNSYIFSIYFSPGIVTGDCVFNDYSHNDGTIYGDCIFNNSSFNSNIINGDCVFNNSSRNASLYAYNPAYMAQIIGNASFYDDSFNYGLVSGSVIYDGFTGTNSFGSFVNGQILSRTFYFNAAVNTDLATLGNWWMNSSYTIAATALPTVFDDAIINGPVSQNSGSDITLSNLTVNSAGFGFFNGNSSPSGALTVTGVATFNDICYVFEGNINGNCIFNDDAINDISVSINGNCVFNDNSGNNGTINGTSTFNDYSRQTGTHNGDCIFNDYSASGWITNGNATFNDDSRNGSVLLGSYGTVNGDCVFNHRAYNATFFSAINGNCIFNNTSHNEGPITGNCIFNDSSYNINSNNPASFKNGTITGDCIFNHTSYNAGFVIGYATFNDYSYNRLEYLPDSSAKVKAGAVFKSAVFNDYSANEGQVSWGATYNHNSRMGSELFWAGVGGGGVAPPGEPPPRPAEEVATFNDSSYVLAGSIYMDAFFNHSSYYNPEYYPTLYYPPVFQNRTPYPIPRGINGSSILGIV